MKKFTEWVPNTLKGVYLFWIFIIALVFALDDYRSGDLIHYIVLLLLPPLSAIAIYIFMKKK